MILLDTHATLWLRAGDARLSPVARGEIERAWQAEEVAMSAMSFWEMAMLREKGPIEYPDDVSRWRLEQLRQGLIEIPVDGEIGIRANELRDFHADPADRTIVATAMNGHEAVTINLTPDAASFHCAGDREGRSRLAQHRDIWDVPW